MSKAQVAENFAKEIHLGTIRKDSNISHYEHLTAVVARLKNLGVTDEDILAAAWLQDAIDYTNTSFDELDQRFGSRVAVLILSMSKDKSLPRSIQEEQHVKQLKESTLDAKLIKLCDISSSIKNLKNSPLSRTRKIKEMKKKLYYLNVIKPDLIKNKDQVPGIAGFVNGVNDVITSYGLRPVVFQWLVTILHEINSTNLLELRQKREFMALGPEIKKELENAIKNWCPNVTILKKGETRLQKVWKFKNGSDFIYGYLVGQMEGYIAGFIVGRHGKIPDSEENKEIRKMVEIRAKEIRQVMSSHEKKDKTN